MWREFGSPLLAPTAPGSLTGTSVAVKDLFDVAGHRVGAGNPVWLAGARPATRTAPVVAALLAAGAAIAGIARTDEFAYSLAGTNGHYGTPPNPAAPDRIPGGSSSGPAAAVALGQADVGLGTDTGGSIRVPASYQGLYGIRPSHGVIDTAGVLPLAPSFDTVGWLTRDPGTLSRVGRVLLPPRPDHPIARAVVSDALLALASTDVRTAVRAALDRWGAARDLPPIRPIDVETDGLTDVVRAFQTVQGWEAWRDRGAWITGRRDSLNPDVGARFDLAARHTREDRDRAGKTLRAFVSRMDTLLGEDLLVLPSASSVAPTRAGATLGGPVIEAARAATFALTCVAGATGRCAVSVPLPTDVPIGLCLVGPRGRDLDVLRLAEQIRDAGIAV